MRRKLKKLLSILTSRLVIIGLLILIQLAWFLILFLRLTQCATWINAGFVALSLLIELYIINKSGILRIRSCGCCLLARFRCWAV